MKGAKSKIRVKSPKPKNKAQRKIEYKNDVRQQDIITGNYYNKLLQKIITENYYRKL